ncbi:MAG: type VI secretion system lipoprotein TssJ [Desulfobacteraceae bacterium]|nr:MAG: type VI secretion system lipoprotein TssJ [Desulfobacteraceae bacterium]
MIYRLLSAICAALLISGCASQPTPPPEWGYEKDAVQIHLKADAKLNLDDNVPHTLVLCIYQLRDPNTFNQLSDDTEGIYKLLECNLFDGSVATAKRIIVHPGQDMTVKLDRAEGAKYVAVAAGYYVLQKSRMVRLYDIPVVVETKGLVKKTTISKPGTLVIDLDLGPSQIRS